MVDEHMDDTAPASHVMQHRWADVTITITNRTLYYAMVGPVQLSWQA